jgi:hypothetical protein
MRGEDGSPTWASASSSTGPSPIPGAGARTIRDEAADRAGTSRFAPSSCRLHLTGRTCSRARLQSIWRGPKLQRRYRFASAEQAAETNSAEDPAKVLALFPQTSSSLNDLVYVGSGCCGSSPRLTGALPQRHSAMAYLPIGALGAHETLPRGSTLLCGGSKMPRPARLLCIVAFATHWSRNRAPNGLLDKSRRRRGGEQCQQ